jgi:hypothetical protein
MNDENPMVIIDIRMGLRVPMRAKKRKALLTRLVRVQRELLASNFKGDATHISDLCAALEQIVSISRRAKACCEQKGDQ